MKTIRDRLYGQPVLRQFQDPILGEFTAHVRPAREERWHLWRATPVLDGNSPTYVELSGDGRAPSTALIQIAHQIVQGLPQIAASAEAALRQASSVPFSDFHLERFGDWDTVDEIFQLDFVPRAARDLREMIEFEWTAEPDKSPHRVRIHPRPIPIIVGPA